ncbi:hypothetical protein ACTS9E_01160 [Empedobacter brevis]
MEVKEIIEELKALDLSTFPEDRIKELLKALPPVPIITTDYGKGKFFERAVNNTDQNSFNTKSRISYKPAEFNKIHQRASTPDNTMFYAAIIPEELSSEEIRYARIIGSHETVDLLRENIDGERIVTFGKWEVIDIISVVTIFDPNVDYQIDYINRVRDFYNKQQINPIEIAKRDDVLAFLASEFSKDSKGQSHNYLISSIMTELLTSKGIDGILYPSVQTVGYGLCIALHPRVMERLRLDKVLQCKIIRDGDSIKILNEKVCKVGDNSETFELKDITADS